MSAEMRSKVLSAILAFPLGKISVSARQFSQLRVRRSIRYRGRQYERRIKKKFYQKSRLCLGYGYFGDSGRAFRVNDRFSAKGQNGPSQKFNLGGSYKALVCVFLGGGNDGNNMIVPIIMIRRSAIIPFMPLPVRLRGWQFRKTISS